MMTFKNSRITSARLQISSFEERVFDRAPKCLSSIHRTSAIVSPLHITGCSCLECKRIPQQNSLREPKRIPSLWDSVKQRPFRHEVELARPSPRWFWRWYYVLVDAVIISYSPQSGHTLQKERENPSPNRFTTTLCKFASLIQVECRLFLGGETTGGWLKIHIRVPCR